MDIFCSVQGLIKDSIMTLCLERTRTVYVRVNEMIGTAEEEMEVWVLGAQYNVGPEGS